MKRKILTAFVLLTAMFLTACGADVPPYVIDSDLADTADTEQTSEAPPDLSPVFGEWGDVTDGDPLVTVTDAE